MTLRLSKKILSLGLMILLVTSCTPSEKKPEYNYTRTGDKTTDSLSELIFKNSDVADNYYQRAKRLYNLGDKNKFDIAIKDMAFALQRDSNNIKYHYLLSDLYLNYAQSRLAVETLERAASIAPDSLDIQFKLARTYYSLKLYPAALGALDKIFRTDRQSAPAYFLAGMVAKETGDTVRAFKALQKSADIDGSNSDVFIELGNLYSSKHSPLAKKYFNNALLINPKSVEARMALAYDAQNNNNLDEALKMYENVVTENPNYTDAYFNIGVLQFEQKKYTESLQNLEIVLNQKPSYYKAYYYRGAIKEISKDYPSALIDFKRALEFNSSYEKAIEGVQRLGN